MASIPVADLRPGMRLAYDLRDNTGRLLLAARRPLTDVVIRALAARAVQRLPLKAVDELPEGVAGPETARRSWLLAEPGKKEHAEEGDADGPVIGAGLERAEAMAEMDAGEAMLTEREAKEGARVRSALRRAADAVVAHRSARWRRLPARVRAGAWEDVDFVDGAELLSEREPLWGAERIGIVRRLLARLAMGENGGAGTAHELAREMTEDAVRDAGGLLRATIEGVREAEDMYAPDLTPLAVHAYATACVSVVIAARLGWDDGQILAAGLAGLLADCGLTLLTWNVRAVPRELTDVEQNAVRRHTAYSAALLEMLRPGSVEESIPEEVQLAAYQHHEREDGSGYPLRLKGEQIHDVARLVAVADVLVGLVAARPDRPGLAPSSALAEVARQANSGKLALQPARALAEVMVSESVRMGRAGSGMGVRMAA